MKETASIVMFFFGMLLVSSQEEANRNITICWDVSASMAVRDLDKELSVLEKLFERNTHQEVQLLLFGIDTEEKIYKIKDGDWTQLKHDLEQVSYDGGTIYSGLKGKIKSSNVYVFTDGQKTLSTDILSLDGKSYLINSSPNRDAKFLERTALLNKSRLMDFANMLPENVKKLQQKAAEGKPRQKSNIGGTVYIDNKPAPDVRVMVKGLSDSFLTGPTGDFSIPAQVGDTLVITSRNDKTVKVVAIEAMTHTNVFMEANIVALDEVVVIEEQLDKAELALTGYGFQKKESIGYTVSELDASEISEVTTVVGDAINTKVAGLEIPGQNAWDRSSGGLGAAKIRGNGSINMNTNALVVVNGVPMKRSDTSNSRGVYATTNANMDYIDPANIASITVLKGLAATNAYGGEGRGGVILITTKTALLGAGKGGKPVDRALLKNNVYDETKGELAVDASQTLIALSNSDSPKDAYETYLALRSFNSTNIKFLLDSFSYFKDRDAEMAGKIISNLLEWNTDDVEVLKIVSQAFSVIGDYKNVVLVNEEIIKRTPSDLNAYYNRATAKTVLGEYQEALNELLALERGNTYFSVNASGISKTLKREIKNLISKHKGKLNLSNVEGEYLNNVKYKVRLVFEWNVGGAEFELQFVNPQKRYFNWEHTNTALRTRIEDELKNNYRVEEYEFYGDVGGEWVINATYLGENKSPEKTPLVLKTTIYKDFGYPSETREDILVHFSQANEKKNLKRLTVK